MNYIVDFPDVLKLSKKEANIPVVISNMLDLIEEDLQWYIEYIRIECFDPVLLSLALNDIGVTGITADIFDR